MGHRDAVALQHIYHFRPEHACATKEQGKNNTSILNYYLNGEVACGAGSP